MLGVPSEAVKRPDPARDLDHKRTPSLIALTNPTPFLVSTFWTSRTHARDAEWVSELANARRTMPRTSSPETSSWSLTVSSFVETNY